MSVEDLVGNLWKMGRTSSEADFAKLFEGFPSSGNLSLLGDLVARPPLSFLSLTAHRGRLEKPVQPVSKPLSWLSDGHQWSMACTGPHACFVLTGERLTSRQGPAWMRPPTPSGSCVSPTGAFEIARCSPFPVLARLTSPLPSPFFPLPCRSLGPQGASLALPTSPASPARQT